MNDSEISARALWIEKPGSVALRTQPLAPAKPGEVLVRTLYSGISRGTERVIFQGEVPESERASMRCPFQEGDLPGPLKYGYCNVGRVEAGEPAMEGQAVFCLYPHQTRYVVPRQAIVPLPKGVPQRRALLAANMETAINALWDSGMTVGSRVVVIGAGVVGLLVAHLARLMPGARVVTIDKNPARRGVCEALGIQRTDRPSFTPDIIFEASAAEGGLQTALDIAGMETRVVVLSWYGTEPISLNLGGAFHAKRLTISASQVGQISPNKRPRWSHRQRMSLALSMLDDARLDALISGSTPFADIAGQYEEILLRADDTLCHAIDYSEET